MIEIMHFNFAQCKQRGFTPILVVILIVAVSLGGYFTYQWVNKSSSSPPQNQIACTEEAKLCPDGTSVGRTGPNCEFSPCPTTSIKTYQNATYKYSLQYPTDVTLQNGVPSDDLKNTNSLEVGYHLGQPSFKIATIQVTNLEISDFKNPQHSTLYPTLKEFVDKIWLLNKEDKNPYTLNKQVGDIKKIELDNQEAYQFTLTGSFISNFGALTLDEEHLVIFTMKNKKVYILMYPTTNQSLKQTISSFKFTP